MNSKIIAQMTLLIMEHEMANGDEKLAMTDIRNMCLNNYSKDAKMVRDKFCNYCSFWATRHVSSLSLSVALVFSDLLYKTFYIFTHKWAA